MSGSMRERALALAGLLQAVKLVQRVAQEGVFESPDLDAVLASVFRLDADSTEAVYGSAQLLKPGLEALIGHLEGGLTHDTPSSRIVVSVLHVERKLAGRPQVLARIGEGVRDAARQREHFGVGHSSVAAKLGELYAATVSTVGPRVLVQGNPLQLSQAAVVAQIRAVLLAAMRSAVLWRQLGGSYWDVLLRRRPLLEAAKSWR